MPPGIAETGLKIPANQEWPVQGRDRESGGLLIRAGFIEAVEEANGLEVGTLTEDDLISLLIIWYADRLEEGHPRDPAMDAIVEEELGELGDEDEVGDDDPDTPPGR